MQNVTLLAVSIMDQGDAGAAGDNAAGKRAAQQIERLLATVGHQDFVQLHGNAVAPQTGLQVGFERLVPVGGAVLHQAAALAPQHGVSGSADQIGRR